MSKKYPEHEKLKKVQKESQVIHEFISEFLAEKKIMLGRYQDFSSELDVSPMFSDKPQIKTVIHNEFAPVREDLTKLVAEFFGIKLDKLEKEKLAMLSGLRRKQDERKK